MTQNLEEFNRRWLEAWTARDIPDLLSYYADDVVYFDVAVPQGLRGKEALEAYLKQNFAAMGALHFHVQEFWPVDQGFFCRWTADIAGSNRRLRGLDLALLADGKIFRNELYTHWLDA